MKTGFPSTRKFEFYFHDRDTLVQVESSARTVVVRASRDTFSEQRKSSFVRELAAEGFIPDGYQWFSLAGPDSYLGVRWLVDISWLELPEIVLAQARRFMTGLLVGATLLWLAVLTPVFLL